MPDEGRLVLNTGTQAIPVTLPNAVTGVGVRMNEGQTRRFVLADAWDRAWRTFKTGVGLDIGIAVVLVLLPAFTNIEWTAAYWAALASAVGKSVLQAVVSYYYRRWKQPKVGVEVR